MTKRTADSDLKAVSEKRSKMDDAMNVDSGQVKIDEDLHSRQLAVYGKESMKRMANADIVILGLKGLGVEVGAFLRTRVHAAPRLRVSSSAGREHAHTRTAPGHRAQQGTSVC